MHNLDQDHKLQTKEYFILWIERSSSSKATPFLSFQTIQKKHKGAALQTFTRFLPTNKPCHPRRTSFTNDGRTHSTPERLNNNSHKTLALVQCFRRWSIDSSAVQQRYHLFWRDQSLFFSCSNVRALPQEASRAKKTNLSRNTWAPNNAFQERDCVATLHSTIKGLT